MPHHHLSPFSNIFRMWWPLAGSWLLMGLELPLVTVVLSRFHDPEIQLAAFGGVVFPLALLIEAPIIMVLSASTALCKDWPSYRLLRNFILGLSGCLTVLHIAVSFTPLYWLIVIDLLGVPTPILEPARLGLQIMTPWTMSIAIRRFLQGVVIRSGHTRLIGLGTLIRICISGSLLGAGLLINQWPGIVVAALAMATGVIVEAGFIRLFARVPLRELQERAGESTLSLRDLINFYTPLATTPLMTLSTLPLISAALSRMPMALESLAVWPVIGGLTFVFRSVGFAFQEVVIALSGRREFISPLRRFAGGLACGATGILFLIAMTPLSTLWFERVAALRPDLSGLAIQGLWIALFFPMFSPLESLFNGVLVHHGLTRYVTQAVLLYSAGSASLLGLGILHGGVTGLYIGLLSVTFGLTLQTIWLVKKGRPFLQSE